MSAGTRALTVSALSLAAALALTACGGSAQDDPAQAGSTQSTGAEDTASTSPSDAASSSASASESADDTASSPAQEPESPAASAPAPAPAQEGTAPAAQQPDGTSDGSPAGSPADAPAVTPSEAAAPPSAQQPVDGQDASPGAPIAAPAADPGACDAASLTGALQPSNAGAGSVFYDLVLTNTGSQPCVLAGYPGVSYLDAAGQPVGVSATRDGSPGTPVTVAPGESASAPMREGNAANYGQVCNPHQSASLLVYPPNATDALTIAHSVPACGNPKIHQLGIQGFGA